MIGKDQIAEACRYNDALIDEGHDLAELVRKRGIDMKGLVYVANQRALRMAMVMSGQDPRRLPRDRKTAIDLPPETRRLLEPLASVFLDGFMAGRVACDPNDRIQRYPQRCKRCGGPLDNNGLCDDETCPYSDRRQHETWTED